MNKSELSSILLASLFFLALPSLANATNIVNTTTLRIVGLPAGVNVPLQIQNPLGTYTIKLFKTTDWTTILSIPYANAMITTYSGQIPYQFMGNGTTLLYQGTTYTINESAGAGFTGFIMSNSMTYTLPFYAYFNAMAWSAQQANELMAMGVNGATAMQIAGVKSVSNSTDYGTIKQAVLIR